MHTATNRRFVEDARNAERALHPRDAHERAELRLDLSCRRADLSPPTYREVARLSEDEVHELSNSDRACRLPTDVLRATARRVAVAAGYGEA